MTDECVLCIARIHYIFWGRGGFGGGGVKWVLEDIDSDAEIVDDLDGSFVSIIVNESFSVGHTSHRIGGNQERS